jgi:hypothetical protein
MMLDGGGRYDVTEKGGATVDQSHADIETHLVDIQDMPLGDLRKRDAAQLAPYLEMLLQQVSRPRYNLGGSGPPGRVD